MTTLLLEYPPAKARDLVRTAFERTDGVSSIDEGERQIIGKTGLSFPRFLWSWGEHVFVDFSETDQEGTVKIDVWAERAIGLNVFATPQKYKRRFLAELDLLRQDTSTESPFEQQNKPEIWTETIEPVIDSFLASIMRLIALCVVLYLVLLSVFYISSKYPTISAKWLMVGIFATIIIGLGWWKKTD